MSRVFLWQDTRKRFENQITKKSGSGQQLKGVQRERMKNTKELLLLSYNDVRILLEQNIKERADYDREEIRMEQMSKRHKQRSIDTMRYY